MGEEEGRGGRGRGGRGGYNDSYGDRESNSPAGGRSSQSQSQQIPKVEEDFPALPPSKSTKVDTTAAPLSPSDIPLSPPIGKWDEEVAAMDDKNKG